MSTAINEQPTGHQADFEGSLMGIIKNNNVFVMKKGTCCVNIYSIFDKSSVCIMNASTPFPWWGFVDKAIEITGDNSVNPEAIQLKRGGGFCCCNESTLHAVSSFGSPLCSVILASNLLSFSIHMKGPSDELLGKVKEVEEVAGFFEKIYEVYVGEDKTQMGRIRQGFSNWKGRDYNIEVNPTLDATTKLAVMSAAFLIEDEFIQGYKKY